MPSKVQVAKRFARHALARAGVAVHFVPRWQRHEGGDEPDAIAAAHEQQSAATVAALREKYANPVFGSVETWSLLTRLAECIDPSDPHLGCASQQVHVLQVLEGMEREGIRDPDLLLAALLHDLGKLLLLTDELPANIVCMNGPIGAYPPGIGLDRCLLQWGHDELAYQRLKGFVSEPVAWLLRYHSIDLHRCRPLMDERDRVFLQKYLLPFRRFDLGTKSKHYRPRRRIDDYRAMIAQNLPAKIEF